MKYPKSIILTLLIVLLITLMPLQTSAASLLSYNIKVNVEEGGKLFFNYGKNGRFFLSSDWEEYDSNCLITSGETYDFTKLLDRGFIAAPDEGYYFDGFYSQSGKSLPLDETKLDILRVSVNGIYFFNCFPSRENTGYKRLTKTAYQNQVKLYLKGLYGTTRYKVMDTVTLYEFPKADTTYTARFQKKTVPNLDFPSEVMRNVYRLSIFNVQHPTFLCPVLVYHCTPSQPNKFYPAILCKYPRRLPGFYCNEIASML